MKMHPFHMILAFLGFILITSKELIWLRPWTGPRFFNSLITALFAIHFLLLFTRYNTEKAILTFRPKLRWKAWPNINLTLALFSFAAVFYLFHELFIGDSDRCFKYAIYFLFLISLLTEGYDLQAVSKIFAVLSIATSVALLIQFFLVTFVLDNDLSNLPRLLSLKLDGTVEFDEVNPFGLGLIGDGSLVQYAWFEFHRLNAYTTEPKYCSQVLIAGLVALFSVRDWRSQVKRLGGIFIGLGLLVSHAYSTVSVLAVAALIQWLGRSRHAMLYTLVIVVMLTGSVTLLFTYKNAISGYAGLRVASFLSQMEMVDDKMFDSADLVGHGVQDPRSLRVGLPPIPRYFIQFGQIGVFLQLATAIMALFCTLKGISLYRSTEIRWALALSCSLTVIFTNFFNSEPLSPLYSYLLALIFHLTGEKQMTVRAKEAAAKAAIPIALKPGFEF